MGNFCQRYGKKKKQLAPKALRKLRSYHWPGNVRELKNTIERLAIMVPGDKVKLSHLPLAILNQDEENKLSSSANWREAREDFERRFLLEKLLENQGNISRTASAIGMERTHLHRKLKKYDIKVK